MLSEFSLIIAGPLKSRISEELLVQKLRDLVKIQDILGFKLIFVTYPDEFPNFNLSLPNLVIKIADPGSDDFRSGPELLGYQKRNTTRMLLSVTEGLKKSYTRYSIRTRVELLPQLLKINDFANTCLAAQKHIDQNYLGIAFISEHYYGLSRQEKGVHTWLPDTFQIMKTSDMKTIWDTAHQIWNKNKNMWHDIKVSFPLANEQIMGLAFLIHLSSNEIGPRIDRFHRFNWDKKLIQYNKLAESEKFYTFKFNSSGLSQSKLNSRFEKRKQMGAKLPVSEEHSHFLLFKFWLSHLYNFLKNSYLQKIYRFLKLIHNSKI